MSQRKCVIKRQKNAYAFEREGNLVVMMGSWRRLRSSLWFGKRGGGIAVKSVGILLLALSGALGLYAVSMDVTVPTVAGERFVNLSLLGARQTYLTLSGFLFLGGVILVGFASIQKPTPMAAPEQTPLPKEAMQTWPDAVRKRGRRDLVILISLGAMAICVALTAGIASAYRSGYRLVSPIAWWQERGKPSACAADVLLAPCRGRLGSDANDDALMQCAIDGRPSQCDENWTRIGVSNALRKAHQ